MELNIRQDLGYIIFVLWPYVVKNQAWFKLVHVNAMLRVIKKLAA